MKALRFVPWAIGISLGAVVGISAYTFYYAKGAAYLTNDPKACMNCHIMRDHFDAWLASSHHAVAVCNDCHAPKDFFGKYSTKLSNGFWHSVAFTSGKFKEPIRIRPRNQKIVETACRTCHESVVHAIDLKTQVSCLHCHKDVGHR